MTEEKKRAVELVEQYQTEINESDFHIPKFISGIDMESDEYSDLLNKETKQLAKQCALICCDEIIQSLPISVFFHEVNFWQNVKKEIEKL